MAIRICIDAGHGGEDRGMTYNKRSEANDALRFALILRKKMIADGLEPVMTRARNETISIYERCLISNRTHCRLTLSIHRASLDLPHHEVTCWVKKFSDDKTRRVALALSEAVSKSTGLINRGVKRGDYAINDGCENMCVRIEIGSIESDKDNKLFDEHMEECAEEISKTVKRILGIRT